MARRRVTRQPGEQAIGPIAVVQIVQRNWTKASRGAPLPTQRRQLPDAILLPQALASDPPPRYLIQRAEFDETAVHGEPSRLTMRQETTTAPRRFDNIELRPLIGALQVDLRWA